MSRLYLKYAGETIATNGGRVFYFDNMQEAERNGNLVCSVQELIDDDPGDVEIATMRDGQEVILAGRYWSKHSKLYDADWTRYYAR